MLKLKIQGDVKDAMKSGNQETVTVLRMVLSAMSAKEKDKRYKIAKEKPEATEEELIKESALTDEQVVEVLSSEIKKRKDAIALYEQGSRPELAATEKKEITILQVYMPEQLSADVLRKMIEQAIAKTGATTIKDMGKVMADLAPNVKGKADNKEISNIIKELLT